MSGWKSEVFVHLKMVLIIYDRDIFRFLNDKKKFFRHFKISFSYKDLTFSNIMTKNSYRMHFPIFRHQGEKYVIRKRLRVSVLRLNSEHFLISDWKILVYQTSQKASLRLICSHNTWNFYSNWWYFIIKLLSVKSASMSTHFW